MREIKFRGKATMSIKKLDEMHFEHDNGWFVGNLVMFGKTPYIVGDFIEVDDEYTINEFWVAVHPESVGQYTGEIDIKNNPIIENHIVTFDLYGNGEKQRGVVVYNQAAFYVQTDFAPSADGTHLGRPLAYELGKLIKNEKDVEVIGDIYDDKHLLEESS